MFPDTIQVNELLNKSYSCSCGHTHQTDIKAILLEAGAISQLPQLIRKHGYQHVLFIADIRTKDIFKNYLEAALIEAGISYRLYIFDTMELHPDETAVGTVLMAMDEHTDLIISVGSGTLNDTCRFVSYRCGLPYYCVATAPSMDGYASNVAAMTTAHLKTTYPAHNPKLIIGDLDILRNAPSDMIGAGLGDILGKFTSLCDWRISALITDEYYCHNTAVLTARARDLSIATIDGLVSRDADAVSQLTHALILSGIAMNYAGNSRPASGSEHHISHYWEMKSQETGKASALHGTKVGIATIISLKLYELLQTVTPDFNTIRNRILPPMDEVWERRMRHFFGPAAAGVIQLEHTAHKNSPEAWLNRMNNLELYWKDIINLIKELPSSSKVEGYLKLAGCPIRPIEIGLDKQTVIDSICYAREVRDRYTILQLLWDIGLLKEAAAAIADDLYGGLS